MLKSTLPAPIAPGISGAIVSTYRISVKPSARSSSSAMNCGAVHSAGVFAKVTLVISGAPSAAGARGMPTRPAAAAPAAVVRKPRRDCSIVTGSLPFGSRLQLAFQLVEEAQVSVFSQDLMWTRFDHPCLVQAQRIEPNRIGWIILAPLVVRILLQRLKGIVVPRREAALDQLPCCVCRFGCAKICNLEYCAQNALRCNRVRADKIGIAGEHTAVIVRPRAVHCGAEYHVTDTTRMQLLGLWRKPKEGVDLPGGKQLERLQLPVGNPLKIVFGIEADISRHQL